MNKYSKIGLLLLTGSLAIKGAYEIMFAVKTPRNISQKDYEIYQDVKKSTPLWAGIGAVLLFANLK